MSTLDLSVSVISILSLGEKSKYWEDEKAQKVIDSLKTTQSNFCPNLSLAEIWEQEKEYYFKYGMSAFDCGYCGLSINK